MNGLELKLTRLRALLHAPKPLSLGQYLNLWSFQDGVLVGVNLDYSSVYEIEAENAFFYEPSRLDLFNIQARAFLNSLPPHAVLQFLVQIRRNDNDMLREYRQTALEGAADDWSRTIVQKKCEFIAGKFSQRRRCFLFTTSRTADGKAPMTWLLPIFRRPLKERVR
ncbi:MAG: hypothetical protein KGI84_04135, partial [Elusimicrobia bacterium]|nr:hypothetical protein [Elusimicrobiota bacterium]